MSARPTEYRVLIYQAGKKLGYVRLDEGGETRFVPNWRHATAFDNAAAWDKWLREREAQAPADECRRLLNSAEPWSRRPGKTTYGRLAS